MHRASRRPGFTLVEVLVALALGATVLVGARGFLESLGDHASGVLRVARTADSRNNAEDMLRRAVVDLVVRRDTLPSFAGDESAFAFRSSCVSAQGWREPCDVQVRAERSDSGFQVVLIEGANQVVVRRALSTAGMRYLLAVEEGGTWTGRWQNTLMLPLAIGIIAGDDTIVARVGGRR